MAAAEEILKDPYFADLDIDLSQFSEEEKSVIIGVMQKAKTLDQQDEDKFRQPTEGQLSKWTNLMKGWQFRWFTIDPYSGLLEYYVDKEKKKLGPRGSVYLGGSMIAPSDEDSFTFTVSAANGDIFKLRASDAKERQHWINRLRSVAEFHTSSIAQAAPPLISHNTQFHATHPYALTSVQSTGAVTHQVTTAPSTASTAVVPVDKAISDSTEPTPKVVQLPEEVSAEMAQIRDDLYRIEDTQMVIMDQLELDPIGEESLFPLDDHVLILKATAQSALSTLHHCFSILQTKISDLQSDVPGSREDLQQTSAVTETRRDSSQYPMSRRRYLSFKSQGEKPATENRHFGLHKNPSTPKSQRKDGKDSENTENSSVTCCEKARSEMKPELDSRVEETDDEAYCAGEEPESESVEEHKSIILHLLSQLKLGMDLTKVVLPTFILEPRSLLEMFADFFAHPDLFVKIPDGLTAEDRMLAVLQFYLTSFHAGRKGALAKKPYNPILGETFRCSWDVQCTTNTKETTIKNHMDHTAASKDDGKINFVAEQVSHHPPISGFYAECPSKKVCFNAHIWTKSKFYGMSIGVVNHGEGVISLLEHNEDYVLTFPSTYCRSILTFPWVELGGKVHITCAKTGYNASVTFHTKPFYGGKLHRITGEVKNTSTGKVICKVNGEWNGQIEFSYTSHQEDPSILDTKVIPVCRKRVCPQSSQGESESRRLWHKVTNGLKTDDIEAATSAKHALEERQRKEARERKEAGTEWKTKARKKQRKTVETRRRQIQTLQKLEFRLLMPPLVRYFVQLRTLFHRHGDGWMYNNHLKLTETPPSEEQASSPSNEPTEQ